MTTVNTIMFMANGATTKDALKEVKEIIEYLNDKYDNTPLLLRSNIRDENPTIISKSVPAKLVKQVFNKTTFATHYLDV